MSLLPRGCRSWSAASGNIFDVHALKLNGGQRRHRDRRQRGGRAARGAGRGWRKRIAAPSTNCHPALPCSTPSAGSPSTTNPTGGCGASTRPSSTANPDDSSVLDRLRATRKLPEQPDFRAWKAKLHEAYRAVEPETYTWFLPDGRAVSVVTTPNLEGGVTYLFDNVTESLDLARRFDGLITGAARDARQPRRSGRGVRQQWPRAIVQSGFCKDVEAVGGGNCASSRISRPSRPGASRCSTTI